AIDRALLQNPEERFYSVAAFLRVADRGYASRSTVVVPERDAAKPVTERTVAGVPKVSCQMSFGAADPEGTASPNASSGPKLYLDEQFTGDYDIDFPL
ncbi:MAG: hypothetical protein ACMG6H_08590, partial [Acidobacteriota bacterium]